MTPATAGVHLWIAHEQLLDDGTLGERLGRLLSADELERVQRMKFESGRRQQLLARAMQREALSWHVSQVAPRDWCFVRGPAGRPALAAPFDACGLHFNIAHTTGLVVMAVAHTPLIGVDVEPAERKMPPTIASRYFSTREIDALRALPAQAQRHHCLRLWILKEAYLKARGVGLSGGLDGMSFSLDADGVRGFEHAQEAHAARWVFREFGVRADHRVAVACLDPAAPGPPEFQLHQYLGQ